jgi:hypothetical protein
MVNSHGLLDVCSCVQKAAPHTQQGKSNMVKKAALSVRISESTKKALDEAAAKDHRSTASLVEIILADFIQSNLTGAPRKYRWPTTSSPLASGFWICSCRTARS